MPLLSFFRWRQLRYQTDFAQAKALQQSAVWWVLMETRAGRQFFSTGKIAHIYLGATAEQSILVVAAPGVLT
jgi:hypothetical protein